MTLRDVVAAVLVDYPLAWDGPHGVAHWARVLENGRRLAGATAADPAVVDLFAVLHDARRVSDYGDLDHGPRAADLARARRGDWFDLTDDQFATLHRAIRDHTHEATHPNLTVQACWDADRLDLGRVGIMPHPDRLGTEFARRPETIAWADGRARMQFVPPLVRDEWGIDLAALAPRR